MDVLKKADLEELLEHASNPCISIYMPTHRASVETRQDPIRLKNLLRECELSLEARALRKLEIQVADQFGLVRLHFCSTRAPGGDVSLPHLFRSTARTELGACVCRQVPFKPMLVSHPTSNQSRPAK